MCNTQKFFVTAVKESETENILVKVFLGKHFTLVKILFDI